MLSALKLPKKHKVVFKGSLKKYGEFEIAGYSAAECIRGVAVQIPELYTTIANGYFTVRQYCRKQHKETLNLKQTAEFLSYDQPQIIEVIPVLAGATGNANTDTIIAGASLLIVGIIIGAVTFGVGTPAMVAAIGSTATSLVSSLATSMVLTGLSLLCRGIAGLLAEDEEEEDTSPKYSFSGPNNFSKQGVAIPLIYGKIGVGSNAVSSLMGKIYGTPELPTQLFEGGVNGSIRLAELLGEGPIKGLIEGEKSVLFEGVPLMREDGTKTYPNANITFWTGVGNEPDPYADGLNTPMKGGAEFENNIWQTFTVADQRTDRININIKIHSLYEFDKKKKKSSALAEFQVETAGEDLLWQPASFNTGGNKTEYVVEDQTIYPKISSTATGYQEGRPKGYRNKLVYTWTDENGNTKTEIEHNDTQRKPSPLSFPKTVKTRVAKQTQTSAFSLGYFSIYGKSTTPIDFTIQIDVGGYDRTKPRHFRIRSINMKTDPEDGADSCSLSMYSEQIDLKINYEGRAICYLGLNAEDFQGNLPSRIYEVYGLIIDVPSNYNPETRYYDGVWDGTYKKAWTNNPVWVLYDLLTNSRYGLGREIRKEDVDKWSLYYASMYCDELVSDGKGGKEPRYTFNGVINNREEAFTVLKNVAGVFRSMMYAANGQIFLAQDAPKDIKRTFGNMNVVGGLFSYEGSAATARHTAVEVTWINPDNVWQPEKEIYEDAELIQRYGYNVKSVVATGCTSRGQAIRLARYTIYTEEYENDTVTFQVGPEHSDIRPGDIVYIQDEMIAGEQLMGIVKDISTQTVILDMPVRLSVGQTYQLILTDIYGNTHRKNIVNREMETDTLWLRSDEFFTEEQLKDFDGPSFWTLVSDTVEPRKFKVLGVVEDEEEGGVIYTITGLIHYDEKFKLIDENISFDRPPISSQPEGELQAPTVFRATQSLTKEEGIVRAGAECSWSLPSDTRVSGVEVKIRYPNSEGYVDFGILSDTKLNIDNVGVGKMYAKLRSYSAMTKTYSEAVEFIVELHDPYIAPPMPFNLTGESVAGVAVFKWDKPLYQFPVTYEYYFISPSGTDTPVVTTNNAASLSRAFNKYPANVAIYVRAINEVGMMSDYAKTSVSVTPADLNIGDFLEDIDDSWLTGDSQQMVGSGGLLEQISVAMLRGETYIISRVDKTDKELAFAVDGLSALTEDHKALATRFTALGAFVGEQLTSDDPDKFNLKWYDGSDPKYPQTPNPLYDPEKETSVDNYPYLPAYPQESLAGQISEVYAGSDYVKAQLASHLSVQSGGVKGDIREEMVTTINNKGEVQTNYTVRVDGYNREGQPIIGGFGLHSDGYRTQFGVNAHTFWIRDPEWKQGDNPYNEYLFVTDTQKNLTYIGTDNTIFKGKVQSLTYLEKKEGFSLDPTTNTFELNTKDLRFKIENTGHNKWFKRNGTRFYQIVDIGETDPNGYSYALNVDASKFRNSGSIFQAKSQPYRLSIFEPRSNETSCINVKGGNVGIRDLSNEGMKLRTSNKDVTMYVSNYNHRQNCFLQFNPITCQLNWDGYNGRLDIEISRVVATFYVFMREYLNDRIDAEIGSMVMLPNPFTIGFPNSYGIVDTHNFNMEQHCLWLKTQRRTVVNDAGKEFEVIKKDTSLQVYFMDGYDNNKYAGIFPSSIAGWERITGPQFSIINNKYFEAYYEGRYWCTHQKYMDNFGPIASPYAIKYI